MSVLSRFRRNEDSLNRSGGLVGTESASFTLPGEETADQLLAQRRYGRILSRDSHSQWDQHTLAMAWLALEEDMALVPGRDLVEGYASGRADQAVAQIPSLHLDRYAVTNADFARFISGGGYSQTDLWPREIWPNVLQFVDSTGYAGPRFWKYGKPDKGTERHPVVGVCWFEARAFALWAGKRLPTSREWQNAASWCAGTDGQGGSARYPWGSAFSPLRANTWMSGVRETVPVDQFEQGCTPNGIYQLIGNVWEWVATQYEVDEESGGVRVTLDRAMAEIRGGAFDTYFETQATCQFRSGQPFLYRARNVGFRCCVPASQLTPPPDPSAFL